MEFYFTKNPCSLCIGHFSIVTKFARSVNNVVISNSVNGGIV